MLDLQQIQALAQYSDNLEIIFKKLEKNYADNDAEGFNESKNKILEIQKKISDILNEKKTLKNDI